MQIASNLNAFSEDEKKRYDELLGRLKGNMMLIEESDSGYQIHLNYNKNAWLEIAEWITLENMCCPFFQFAQQLITQDKIIILHITGPEGAKEILKQELQGGGCY